MSKPCEHLEGVEFVDFVADSCPDCVAMGSTWKHLRQCLTCDYVGCCNDSPNKHASRHAAANPGHPAVRSAEPGELWLWCFEHELGTKPRP